MKRGRRIRSYGQDGASPEVRAGGEYSEDFAVGPGTVSTTPRPVGTGPPPGMSRATYRHLVRRRAIAVLEREGFRPIEIGFALGVDRSTVFELKALNKDIARAQGRV